MPFYAALCPLVPEKEKGQKGQKRSQRSQKVRKSQRQRPTLYALLCRFMPFLNHDTMHNFLHISIFMHNFFIYIA